MKRFRGSHKFICDRCRLEYGSERKRKEWNGLVVCDDCWEPRHPSDLYRQRQEDTSVPDPRPEPAAVFAAGPTCTIESRVAKADQGAADCAQTDFNPVLS